MRCLLVEDERPIGLMLMRLLTDMGLVVTWEPNGSSAIDRIDSDEFDLAVLDVLLPGKNGYEVCRHARSKGKTFPVLFLSAMDELEDKVSGFNSGADDYLCKPFEVRELMARLNALTRRSKTPRQTPG